VSREKISVRCGSPNPSDSSRCQTFDHSIPAFSTQAGLGRRVCGRHQTEYRFRPRAISLELGTNCRVFAAQLASKLQHWRALRSIYARRCSPMLGFVFKISCAIGSTNPCGQHYSNASRRHTQDHCHNDQYKLRNQSPDISANQNARTCNTVCKITWWL
jgi:hypothetical protein